ncbi:hypothetical protein ACN677_04340 [Lactiplantibacillus paraplantarum]|uniref:hypothetical protein n=2 Tax=Lactobacillaceae TaxID=33958 RepID=UPI000A17C802|nr:hypothetical protein B5726_05805 [Lactiplantibacillus plantarum]RWZ47701.1 hypothetical protein EQJ06_05775 [Lactiplantibacillus plantarum]
MGARVWRNKFSILIFVATFIICWLFKISPSSMPNYQDAISNIVSFSSLTTAIFMAALVFVPKLSIGLLSTLKTDKKFLERILIVTFLYFISSILALVAILALSGKDNSTFGIINISLLLAFLSAAISESIYVFIVIFSTK